MNGLANFFDSVILTDSYSKTGLLKRKILMSLSHMGIALALLSQLGLEFKYLIALFVFHILLIAYDVGLYIAAKKESYIYFTFSVDAPIHHKHTLLNDIKSVDQFEIIENYVVKI